MEWFLLAWRTCTVFRGRAHRTEFWMFALLGALFWFALCLIVSVIFNGGAGAKPHPAAWWLLLVITVTSAFPVASVAARRLHDTGRSGWYLLLGFIPYVGPLALIILLSMPGSPGDNGYGLAPSSPPKASGSRAADAKLLDPLAAERDRLRERFGLSAQVADRPRTVAEPPAVDLRREPGLLSRQPWLIISAFAALEVLLVTGLGFWTAERLGFHVAWLTPIAGLIYGAAGFTSARAAGSPALAGATVALVDVATLFLASGVGPVPQLPSRAPAVILSMLVTAGIPGMLASMAGGWLSERLRPGHVA